MKDKKIDKVIEDFLNDDKVDFNNNIKMNNNMIFDNLDFDTQLQIFLEDQENYEIDNFEK